MGILNFLGIQRYDMDTLEGIASIPVPARDYNTGDPTKDCIYYLLQRKATEHKKNNRMDLAIACLRKSNELSDYEKHPLLTQKEYMRIVKYIEATENSELAQKELEKIYSKHPEFLDRRISNLRQIKEFISRNKKMGTDCVFVSTNNSCPICKKYNRKIYSISGKSKIYPKIPKEILREGGFCPECYLSISSYFKSINSKK